MLPSQVDVSPMWLQLERLGWKTVIEEGGDGIARLTDVASVAIGASGLENDSNEIVN